MNTPRTKYHAKGQELESGLMADRFASTNDDAAASLPNLGFDRQSYKNFLAWALNDLDDDRVPSAFKRRTNILKDRDPEGRDRSLHDMLLELSLREADSGINKGLDALQQQAADRQQQAQIHALKMEALQRKMEQREEFLITAEGILEDYKRNGQLDREKAIQTLRKKGADVPENISNEQLGIKLRREHDFEIRENILDLQSYEDEKRKREIDEQARAELEDKIVKFRQRRNEAENIPDPSERNQNLQKLNEDVEGAVSHGAAQQEQDIEKRRQLDQITIKADKNNVLDDSEGFSALAQQFGEAASAENKQIAQTQAPAPQINNNSLGFNKV